jgi:hypothetical protein
MTKRFKKFLLIVYIAIFVVTLVGTTYAYFIMLRVSNTSPKVEVSSARLATLYFEIEHSLVIDANPDIFEIGMDSLTASTYAKAHLEIEDENQKENSAKYNMSLNVTANNLEYVTSEKKAELILKVTDPNGNEVTNINGLSYTSVANGKGEVISGFDITEAKGSYVIASNYEIKTNKSTEQTWNVSVTLVNLDSDQDQNIDKSFKAELKIEKAG